MVEELPEDEDEDEEYPLVCVVGVVWLLAGTGWFAEAERALIIIKAPIQSIKIKYCGIFASFFNWASRYFAVISGFGGLSAGIAGADVSGAGAGRCAGSSASGFSGAFSVSPRMIETGQPQ